MIGKWPPLLLFCALVQINLSAQCKYEFNEVDLFDSTHLVVMPPVNVGFIIPSNFETVDGLKLVEEGKVVMAYSQDDKSKLVSFFMIFGLLEREFLKIDAGENIMIAFADSTVIGLYNNPDKGEFDRNTNMRIYQHTALLPLDTYYKCVQSEIIGIRVRYLDKKRDIVISPEQSEKLRKYFQCLGEAVGIYPLDP